MKLFKNIFSSFLLLIFIFYSLGILNHYVNKDEAVMDCSMKKSCSCCEMNSATTKSCCSSHTKKFSFLDLPCHHPNFEGISFKFDPIVISFFNQKLFITDYSDYKSFSYNFYNQTESESLLKPPRT
jgi:hypothetical protein